MRLCHVAHGGNEVGRLWWWGSMSGCGRRGMGAVIQDLVRRELFDGERSQSNKRDFLLGGQRTGLRLYKKSHMLRGVGTLGCACWWVWGGGGVEEERRVLAGALTAQQPPVAPCACCLFTTSATQEEVAQVMWLSPIYNDHCVWFCSISAACLNLY
jgi:hypothetical protein